MIRQGGRLEWVSGKDKPRVVGKYVVRSIEVAPGAESAVSHGKTRLVEPFADVFQLARDQHLVPPSAVVSS
jgi:hypothetical protein